VTEFSYTPDIFETDAVAGPIDQGKLRAFLEQVLIPNADSEVQARRAAHPGVDFRRRDDGTFEAIAAFDGAFIGRFDSAVFPP
jgi:hypothetical protein